MCPSRNSPRPRSTSRCSTSSWPRPSGCSPASNASGPTSPPVSGYALFSLLGAVFTIVGTELLVAVYTADWSESVEFDLQIPFSLGNALEFGGVFLIVVAIGGIASSTFGSTGFVLTAALTGLVSSAGATTSAVLLYRGASIDQQTAMLSILAATAASILVKAALTAAGPNRQLAVRVALWSSVVLVGASLTAAFLLL